MCIDDDKLQKNHVLYQQVSRTGIPDYKTSICLLTNCSLTDEAYRLLVSSFYVGIIFKNHGCTDVYTMVYSAIRNPH